MNPIEETNKSLEKMELMLKSIDYQLTRLVNLISLYNNRIDQSLPEAPKRDSSGIPEMITIKEASRRTGLSYDYLRKECIRGNLIHIRVGNGKYLLNFDLLKAKLESSHGFTQNKKNNERGN